MKKILVVLGFCSIILACNSAEKSESTEEAVVETSTTANAGPSKGEQLISSSDCLTCHKVDTKIVGPSYVDVANKYEASEANIEMLAGKIINGGLGVWGEIPMAPHTALSTDDAKEMVKYILSLKTN
ncbi:MAG: c-type cytochrome [Daejeonella sp.]|uniref:c-type cytochrome n=1 Tax=Daejeonella sp. TaxID=2805397 RepID=UPI00273531E4|nr:c-type cytochrome [Daejeonella sp.]MDP3468868.1 c-type cytochrome [Daejeonella sp.]